MAMNLSGGGISRKHLPETAQPLPDTHAVETKIQKLKSEKIKEPSAPAGVSQFLTKPEAAQVLKRFEPLQPVLQKALQGTQTLRREFRDIEWLTQPPPEAAVKNIPAEKTGPSIIPPPVPGRPAEVNLEKPNLTGPLQVPVSRLQQENPLPKMPIHEATAALAGKVQAEPPLHREAPLSGSAHGQVPPLPREVPPPPPGNRVQVILPENKTPLTTLRVPVVANVPVRTVVSRGPVTEPPRHEASLNQPLPNSGQVRENRPLVSSPKPATVSVPPAGPNPGETIVPRREVQPSSAPVLAGALGKNSVPPAAHPEVTAGKSGQVPVPETRPKNSPRDLTAEAVVQSIFSSKALVPQTTVQISKSNETTTTVTFQSKAESPRPVVLLTGSSLPSPRKIAEQSQREFASQLRERGIENFVAEARQSAQIHEVHPLPPQVSEAEGHIAQPLLVKPPVASFQQPETVALNPLRGDNRPQVTAVQGPREENVTPGITTVAKTAPRIGENPVPTLSNLDKLRRILPTNVKSRLLPVPSVNILDLVL